MLVTSSPALSLDTERRSAHCGLPEKQSGEKYRGEEAPWFTPTCEAQCSLAHAPGLARRWGFGFLHVSIPSLLLWKEAIVHNHTLGAQGLAPYLEGRVSVHTVGVQYRCTFHFYYLL